MGTGRSGEIQTVIGGAIVESSTGRSTGTEMLDFTSVESGHGRATVTSVGEWCHAGEWATMESSATMESGFTKSWKEKYQNTSRKPILVLFLTLPESSSTRILERKLGSHANI
ncbi:unnamed protein product [Caretta caretta]